MIVPLARASVTGKRVLVSAGLEVPVDHAGRVADRFRLQCGLPTVRWLLQKKAAVILVGHRGKPHGRVRPALSLKPIARELSRLLRKEVRCFPVARPRVVLPGSVVVLENLRFSKGEEGASLSFARRLAAWGDVYVNDDFSTSHRQHASIVLLPKLLPAFAGPTLLKECAALSGFLKKPKRPFYFVIGGVKIRDKLGAVTRLLPVTDGVLLGGAAASSVLKGRGLGVGASFVEPFRAPRLLFSKKLIVPTDVVIAASRSSRQTNVVSATAIPSKCAAFDIGPETIKNYQALLAHARTVLWAGPLGAIEYPAFQKGTAAVAAAIPKSAHSVAGGGDTIRSFHDIGVAGRFRWLSTGGGAMLIFLSGTMLPGLKALER